MKGNLKYSWQNIVLLLSIIVISQSGCRPDFNNTAWDVDILAPVIKTNLSMEDLIADSLLTADSEGALRLKIEAPLIDLPLDSILKIPDTTVSKEFEALVAINDIPPGFPLPSLTEETQYNLGELALRRIVVRSGSVKLKVKSLVETPIEFEYRIPRATKFGNVFSTNGNVIASSGGDTAVAEYSFDLSDYEVDLRGSNGNGFNTLASSFTVNTSLDGDTVSIESGTSFIIIEYGFENLVPDFGSGYFGQQSSSENETSKLDVLNRITDGQIFLDSVTIGLKVVNPVGADARFNLSQLSSINTRTNSTVDLTHEIVNSDVLLTRGKDISGNAEDVIPSIVNYEINNANSNILDFIQNIPDELGFQFGFELNPLGNVSGGNDFFYYDRPFEAVMDIDIPLRTTLDNLTLVDTVDWNLSETSVIESVNFGSFTVVAINSLPLAGEIEMVLLDDNMSTLGTLVAPPSSINSPVLDANRKVVEPVESRIQLPVFEELVDVLPQTRHVRIVAKFNTAGQPDIVEFYDTYGIDLRIVGRFNVNFGPNSQ